MRKIPFPQANNLERIYKIFMELKSEGTSKFDIIKTEGLADREGAYYLDSLYFLGFVEKYNTKYFLTEKGNELRNKCKEFGRKPFAEKVLEIDFFVEIENEKNEFDDLKTYKEFLIQKIANDYSLNRNTATRRTSTVLSWLQWIDENVKEEKNDNTSN